MDIELLTLKNFLGNTVKIYRDDDSNIIVEGTVIVSANEKVFTHMPVKIHKLKGDLYWHSHNGAPNNLDSLYNFPDVVDGSVYIFGNPKLTSLKYCPKEITGSLICDNCGLTSFDGISEKIGGNLTASHNPIYDVKPLSESIVNGTIVVLDTSIPNPQNSLKTKNHNSSIVDYETSDYQYI